MPESPHPVAATPLSPQVLLEQLRWRYAVKRFDPTRILSEETWNVLEESLILTPSSYGLQPWKFVIITDPTIKAKLPAISWSQRQPQDCSHMVVLAARRTMDASYVDSFIEHVCLTRQQEPSAMDGYRNVLVATIESMHSHLDWNSRQVYIALGQLMVAAACLGVDTCPMEGIEREQYDQLLGLDHSEYTSVVGCAVGYRHHEDGQAQAPKVRFGSDDMIVRM